MPITVRPEPTPNPNSVKFQLSERKFARGQSIMSKDEARAKGNALAEKIFELPGVASVFMTADFVSVNKQDEASWDDLVTPIEEAIRAHFEV